jgi:hypothetical protein
MEHSPVFVKAKARADNNVASLVKAFSSWPEVLTLSSWQGDEDTDAYVAFTVGEDWRDLGEFVRRLSTILGKEDSLCDKPFTLSVEWNAGGDIATGLLRAPRQHVQALAESIRSAASLVAETTT